MSVEDFCKSRDHELSKLENVDWVQWALSHCVAQWYVF